MAIKSYLCKVKIGYIARELLEEFVEISCLRPLRGLIMATEEENNNDIIEILNGKEDKLVKPKFFFYGFSCCIIIIALTLAVLYCLGAF